MTESGAESGETEFWLSDIEQLGENDDQWGFSLYADKDVFLATYIYAGKEAAASARRAIVPVLADAVSIITTEMSALNDTPPRSS